MGRPSGGGGRTQTAAQARASFLRRSGITSGGLAARGPANRGRSTSSGNSDVNFARGVLAAKDLGAPVRAKDLKAAIRTLKGAGITVRR